MIDRITASTELNLSTHTRPSSLSASRSINNDQLTNSFGIYPQDKVNFSPDAKSIETRQPEKETDNHSKPETTHTYEKEAQFSAEEQREIIQLQRRDAEVRAHEQAHLSAAGQHAAGGTSFTYEVGPDGKRYATAGEVPIDLSREPSPEETIAKMQQVAMAALAPINPSAANRNIAARANSIATQARMEINNSTSTTNAHDELTSPADDMVQIEQLLQHHSPINHLFDKTDLPTLAFQKFRALEAYAQYS